MDKERLGLRHIAPYLPYGLRVKRGARILKMNLGQGSSVHWIGISSVLKWFNSDMESKPFILLRPLSDLIKPLPSGEIPLVEMAKIVNTGYDGIEWDNIKIETEYNYSVIDEDYSLLFRFNTENMYFDMNEDGSGISGVPHTDKLFEYLFANHFDVFGLCDKGFAIDINKIND